MKRFIIVITLLCTVFVVEHTYAQPTARRAAQEKQDTGPTLSVRAKSQYTGQIPVPEEVVWKREIYRELDLNEELNSALYYPVEPIGNRMNLFTLLFKLMSENKIQVYEYRLSGTEDFSENNKISFRDVLDRFHIYYEENIDRRDTTYAIDNSDIPSGEVKSYYIKEEWYFDQRTSTYNAKVLALCPVIHRGGDFGEGTSKYPMFWLKYQDASPYLTRMPIMTSNLNNTANITIDDYFTARKFKGDIYKTTNMLNLSLQEYCETDSAMVQEQKRIESQLDAFGKNLWESTRIQPEVPVDSTALASEDTKSTKAAKKEKARSSKKVGQDKASSGSTKVKSSSSSSKSKSKSSSSSAPRVSVRRERR